MRMSSTDYFILALGYGAFTAALIIARIVVAVVEFFRRRKK